MKFKSDLGNHSKKVSIRSETELNIRKEEFINLCNILDKLNIKYFLLGGVLLGAVRNKGFIKWDWDVELCVLSDELTNKFDKLCLDISEKNFTILNYDRNPSKFKIDIKGKLSKEITKYTIMGWNHDTKKKIFWRKTLKIPDHYLINMTQIELFNKLHFAPYPTEKYLEYQYGDWKTPKQTSNKYEYLTRKYYGKNMVMEIIKKIISYIKKSKY